MGTSPISKLTGCLKNVKRTSNGLSAACPAHADRKNSLSIGQGSDGRILVNCFAGCTAERIVKAAGLTMADLFPDGRGGARPSLGGRNTATAPAAGLTLAQYAEAKKLPIGFLQKLGLKQISYGGAPAVKIPYRDRNKDEVATRYRVSRDGDDRFRWKNGTKPRLYGLDRLVPGKSITLVEGESDCHTLWSHRFRAIGVPGAATWREDWAQELDDIPTIYVVIEPDQGGQAMLKWLATSKIRDRVRLIRLDGVKDPSELHLTDPDGFKETFRRARASAVSWGEEKKALDRRRQQEALEKCQKLANEPDILRKFESAIVSRGLVGEVRAAMVIYLSLTSRRLDRPVSIAVTGPSSAGKSFAETLKFFPPSAYRELTAMSERALAYSEEPLKNRFLVLYELAGLSSDVTDYFLRSLLSEGRLRYETVDKTDGGLKSRFIEKEGPTGLLITTTAVRLNPENETRLLSLAVRDTREQTKKVLLALARSVSGAEQAAEDLAEWIAFQEWLELTAEPVVIPYAETLTKMIEPVATRLRRDFKAFLSLIQAHALLHCARRKRDDKGRIVATLKDYEAVWGLTAESFARAAESAVPQTVRQTVEAVSEILSGRAQGPDGGVSVKDVARRLHLDTSTASRRVRSALESGYLRNLDSKPGRAFRLVLGDAIPNDVELLPSPDRLRKELPKNDNE